MIFIVITLLSFFKFIELNDKLTPVVIPSGFVWSTSIILSTKQVNAFKIGRVAHIYICIRNNSSGLVTNGSEIKFLTLPEELAPLYSYIPFSTYASSSVNSRVNAMLFKGDNGIRYLISGTTGVKGYIHMHAAYITKS